MSDKPTTDPIEELEALRVVIARLISRSRQFVLDAAQAPMRNDHQGTWEAFEREIVDAAVALPALLAAARECDELRERLAAFCECGDACNREGSLCPVCSDSLRAQLATAEAEKARAVAEAWESAEKVCKNEGTRWRPKGSASDESWEIDRSEAALACAAAIRVAAPKGDQGE